MKLISKVTVIYRIADDFCKKYEWELNKKTLSLSSPSPHPKTCNRKGRMSDAEMITILVLFRSNMFPNSNISIYSTSVENLKKSSLTFFRIPALWNECHEWRFNFSLP